VEVEVRIDFLRLHPGDEKTENRAARAEGQHAGADGAKPPSREEQSSDAHISVPREVPTFYKESIAEEPSSWAEPAGGPVQSAPAYIPFQYIRESHQRIEIYRKLAQATDKPSLERLRSELRDRFGKIPDPVERLLDIAELKLIAAEHSVTSIETKGDRLMLKRNNDLITWDGKFPRLTRKDPRARLKEIKKLLLALP
jgi:transcription-repair coupling factor (superfamily II helicase)